MVNQTNKQTFAPPLVGFLLGCFFKVCNLAGVECPINSKVYHSFTYLLYIYEYYSAVGASVFAWVFPLLAILCKKLNICQQKPR